MANRQEPGLDQEAQSNLEIIRVSERWVDRLAKRELRFRLASSLLAALVTFASICWGLVFYESAGRGLNSVLQSPNQIFPIVGAAAPLGIIAGSAVYVLLRARHKSELEQVSSIIERMKRASDKQDESVAEDALSLTEKLFALLPNLAKKRVQDPILYGVVATAIALFGGNLAIAILVGAIVWVYFRYETRKKYEEEISKLDSLRRAFEQRKKDFMESL